MGPEQLIGVILLVLILLINLLGRLLGRPAEDEDQALEPVPAPRRVTLSGPAPLGPQDKSGAKKAAPAVIPLPRFRDQLKHRGTLRHGIILMTVLGPCRGLEQHDRPR